MMGKGSDPYLYGMQVDDTQLGATSMSLVHPSKMNERSTQESMNNTRLKQERDRADHQAGAADTQHATEINLSS